MRIQTETFLDPHKIQSIDFDLKKVIWVDPILGVHRDQLSEKLDKIGLYSEHVCLFLNPIDPDLLQGIIFLDRKIGLFDHSLKPVLSLKHGLTYRRKPKPEINEKNLTSLQEALRWTLKMADQKIEYARRYSAHQRELLSHTFNEEALESVKRSLIEAIEHLTPTHTDSDIIIRDSQYGAFTCKGPRYLTYPLNPEIKTWIILKGHAEREISKLILDLKNWAEQNELPYKIDRCPLHQNEIDRLLFPTIHTGIIDGNAYHPFEPVYPDDRVVDMDEFLLNQEALFFYAPELKEDQARYKQKMRQGTLHLQEAANDLWALVQFYEPLNLQECLAT